MATRCSFCVGTVLACCLLTAVSVVVGLLWMNTSPQTRLSSLVQSDQSTEVAISDQPSLGDTQSEITTSRLVDAVLAGNVPEVMDLLAEHSDLDEVVSIPFGLIREGNALMVAAAYGNTDVLRMCLEAGAQFDVMTSTGETALHAAGRGAGGKDIVTALAAKGANMNAQDFSGRTPLMFAAAFGNIEAATAMISLGADATYKVSPGDVSVLMAALESPYGARCADLLIEQGADVTAQDGRGQTTITYASYGSNTRFLGQFIDEGVDVNARTTPGGTNVLFDPRIIGGTMVRLLELGADPNMASTLTGEHPLHARSAAHQVAECLMLLVNGADPNAKDKTGNTPLMASLDRRMRSEDSAAQTVRLLIRHGADIELADDSGRTALFYAVESNDLEAVSWLLAFGANHTPTDARGRSVLELRWSGSSASEQAKRIAIERLITVRSSAGPSQP